MIRATRNLSRYNNNRKVIKEMKRHVENQYIRAKKWAELRPIFIQSMVECEKWLYISIAFSVFRKISHLFCKNNIFIISASDSWMRHHARSSVKCCLLLDAKALLNVTLTLIAIIGIFQILCESY